MPRLSDQDREILLQRLVAETCREYSSSPTANPSVASVPAWPGCLDLLLHYAVAGIFMAGIVFLWEARLFWWLLATYAVFRLAILLIRKYRRYCPAHQEPLLSRVGFRQPWWSQWFTIGGSDWRKERICNQLFPYASSLSDELSDGMAHVSERYCPVCDVVRRDVKERVVKMMEQAIREAHRDDGA